MPQIKNQLTKIFAFSISFNLLFYCIDAVNDKTLVKLNIFITDFLNKYFLSYFIFSKHSALQKSCFPSSIYILFAKFKNYLKV